MRAAALKEGLRVWAEIDLDRLTANIEALKQLAGDARLMVVVKANAYGHGAVSVARAASRVGVWGFGVASMEEGDELRRAGILDPILVLSSTRPAQAAGLLARNLSVTLASFEMGEALSQAAQSLGTTARVHVKVETGMNRFGLLPDEAVMLAERLRDLPGVVVEGLSSHLATADELDDTFTRGQLAAFLQAAQRLDWIPTHHLANTAGLLSNPALRFNLVRAGIGVYGYFPADEMPRAIDLQPVLSLRSRVAKVAELQPGEGVAYGLTWRADRPSRIALVLGGYGDGLRLGLTNRGAALVRGRRAPYIGRVMMDMLTIDITDIPGVEVDDEVTLIGTQGSEAIGADEIAACAGTISYEVLTGLMERVPRLYTREGRLIARQDLTGLRRTLTH